MTTRIEPYTLSDAIRIGAAIRPQTFCAFFQRGKSCALGAAIEGLTGQYCEVVNLSDAERRDDLEEALHDRYRAILDQRVDCPACKLSGREWLLDLIPHLNDTHKWTREAIADFVQSVEDKIGYVTISESVKPTYETVSVS